MTLIQLLNDIANNAPIERGLEYLREVEVEQPEQAAQFARMREADCTPEEVLETLLESHWVCRNVLASIEARANALAYISQLQFSLRLNL